MQCEDLLEGTRSDFRDWEWRYLKMLCHADLQTLRGLQAAAGAVCFHRDGTHALAASPGDRKVVVWDRHTGKVVATHNINALALSRDGTTVAAFTAEEQSALGQAVNGFLNGLRRGGAQGPNESLKIFDALSGEKKAEVAGHRGGTLAAALSADGSQLVTTGRDQTVRVWNARSGEQLIKFDEPDRLQVHPVAISPDGRCVGWKTTDGWLEAYRVGDGKQLLKAPQAIYSGSTPIVAFNDDGTLLASVNGDQMAIWNVESGQLKATLHGHRGAVMALAFAPHLPLLASCSYDNTVRLWNIDSGRELLRLRGHRAGVTYGVIGIAFDNEGKLLVTGGADGLVKIWDPHVQDAMVKVVAQPPAKRGDELLSSAWQSTPDLRQDLDWLFGHMSYVMDLDFTPDGKFIVTCSADGSVKIFDVSTRKVVRDLTANVGHVSAVRVSPDGTTIAAGSGGYFDRMPGQILIWSRATGEVLKTLEGHAGPISRLCFSPDGSRIISASGSQGVVEKGELMIWDVATGKLLAKADGVGAAIMGLDVSPDGKVISTSGYDGRIRFWDGQSAKHLKDWGGATQLFYCVKFSPDGKRLAAGDLRWGVSLYDVDSGNVVWRRKEHSGAVKDITFLNNHRLLSAGVDGSAHIWDMDSGESLLVLRDFASDMNRANESRWPDARLLRCGAEDFAALRAAA